MIRRACPDCGGATRWLHDDGGTWAPGERPILVCTDCGEEAPTNAPCPCDDCEAGRRDPAHDVAGGTLPLCPACVAGIGGAHAGPDAEWRECAPGESCGAVDCAGKGES